MKFYFLILTSVFLLTSSLAAQNSIIKNTTVIPTHINQSFDNKDILIQNRRVLAIRDHLEKDTTVYDKVIDGTGKFLILRMVEAHAYFLEKGMIQTYFLMNLVNGVTTLRSMISQEGHLELIEKVGLLLT